MMIRHRKSVCFLLFVLTVLGAPLLHGSDEEIGVGKPLPDEIGITIERIGVDPGATERGFINLRIVDNRFQLWFLDHEKNVIEPAFPLAILHYRGFVVRKSRYTIQLTPDSSGLFLTSPRVIKPPYHYSVKILLMDKIDEATFSQENPNADTSGNSREEIYPVLQLNQIPQTMGANSGDTEATQETAEEASEQ